jgi:hypothetical protein
MLATSTDCNRAKETKEKGSQKKIRKEEKQHGEL